MRQISGPKLYKSGMKTFPLATLRIIDEVDLKGKLKTFRLRLCCADFTSSNPESNKMEYNIIKLLLLEL